MELNGVGAHGAGENSRFPEIIRLDFTNPMNTSPIFGREALNGLGDRGKSILEILNFHQPHVHQPHLAPLER